MTISPLSRSQDRPAFWRGPEARIGAVQPHGLLLIVREPLMRVVQASTSAGVWLRRPLSELLLATLRDLGGTLSDAVQARAGDPLAEPQPLVCSAGSQREPIELEGAVHRIGPDLLVIELQPVSSSGAPSTGEPSNTGGERRDPDGGPATGTAAPLAGEALLQQLGAAAQAVCQAPSIDALAQLAVVWFKALFGHPTVTAVVFDDDRRGRVLAGDHGGPGSPPVLNDNDGYLESLSGPDRGPARRVRTIDDIGAVPSGLVPRLLAGDGADGAGDADLSRCHLLEPTATEMRMLQAAGATALLSVDIVMAGRLWGRISCLDPSPRRLGCGARAAAELLAEVLTTRISALENHARSQVAMHARRLEQRLLEATAAEGDWRQALFRNPRTLLSPMAASGAVLSHEGEWLRCGAVPDESGLQALFGWLRTLPDTAPGASDLVACTALARENPSLAPLTPLASGVLAVRLSPAGDCLLWLRPPQAAEGSQTTGSAVPWSTTERALAVAFGRTLTDMIVQVNAVRLLLAERQLAQVKAAVGSAREPVVVAGDARVPLHANAAFLALSGLADGENLRLDQLSSLFADPAAARRIIGHVRAEQRPWRGEMVLHRPDGRAVPVVVRAEPVPSRQGSLLGTVFIFEDLTPTRDAEAARAGLDAALARAARALGAGPADRVAGAIFANASLAAMDISEGGEPPDVAPLIGEVRASTERASALLDRIRRYAAGSD